MIYLSGRLSSRAVALKRPDLGLMLNPRSGNRIPDATWWAFENDCYRATPERWLARLPSLRPWRRWCLFTPLPDVVGDARATWERWHQYRDLAAGYGFPLAYVSQDGETRWPRGAACLFVGGTTAWKLSEASYTLAARAKAAGLRLHMGRVNSVRRMVAAWLSGFSSCDGTLLLHQGLDHWLPFLCAALDRVNGPQKAMELWAS